MVLDERGPPSGGFGGHPSPKNFEISSPGKCDFHYCEGKSAFFNVSIAVIVVAPTGKASFVYSDLQMRLRCQYNGK